MQVLTTPLPTRGARAPSRPQPLAVAADTARVTHFWVAVILLLALCNL
ncbi:MAG: hypothetical protein HXX19_12660, partial [Rhodoferax sp.]|nr:hypothetical protein [Rhodoferax sp.]